jgi:hypothetical protein
MQLVERHVIDSKDSRYAIIDEAAFKSKNLYNAALYEIRQTFFSEGVYLTYYEIEQPMRKTPPSSLDTHDFPKRIESG